MKNQGNRYDTGGMIIITILMAIGFAMIYFTGFFNITNYQEFYDYVCKFGMVLIFGGFFIIIGLYCYYSFFKNVIIKPKQKVVYLKSIDNNSVCTFLDEKGKAYYYPNNEYTEDTYYEVLKSKDSILEVYNKTAPLFPIPKEKESYWLNFYSPMGDFENIMLLPIVYVILLPGLLSAIISKGAEKIYGLLFMAYPAYIIIYDLKKKIQKNNKK